MTLSDSQIDRYSRQIVLPEIGSRGQERLLASRVAIRGGGDAALVCASYLAGAGVGGLGLRDVGASGAVGELLGFTGTETAALSDALARRNPDCRPLAEAAGPPAVIVSIGASIPDEFPAESAVVWGAAEEAALVRVHFPAGTACAPCLRSAFPPGSVEGEAAFLLGSLLAVDALRVLLGLSRESRPSMLRLDLSRGVPASAAIPALAGCKRCQ